MVIRVALVNDDEVVVRGLDAMMRSATATASRWSSLVAGKTVAQPVDVALYDTFGMGQGNGPAVRHLVESPQVRSVAVYTWNFQPWLTRDTLSRASRATSPRACPRRAFVDAVTAISSGQLVVSPSPGRSPARRRRLARP